MIAARVIEAHPAVGPQVAVSRPSAGLPVPVMLFLLCLLVPLSLQIGAVRLSPYRLLLILTILPCIAAWAGGRCGPKLLADWCILGICAWSVLSFAAHHGPVSAIEAGGINFIETAGPWFLARRYIRTPEAFFGMARLLFLAVLCLAPFAIAEALTGRNIISKVLGLPQWNIGQRLGLYRVRGPFDHPILFGVFCGATLGLTYFVLGYGRSAFGRFRRAGFVLFTAAFSLSSGPFTAITSQACLIFWDRLLNKFQARWHALGGLAVVAYVLIDMLSTRTPIKVFIHYFSFSSHTAYNRILIWEFGTINIWNSPVFGIGMNEWERPGWMSDSVDMFWILPGMRHGVVVWALYFVLFFSVFIAVARRRGLDPRASAYRTGYLVSMTGLFIAGWAVHFWNASFVYFIFLLASGVWFLDCRPAQKVLPLRGEKSTRRTLL